MGHARESIEEEIKKECGKLMGGYNYVTKDDYKH